MKTLILYLLIAFPLTNMTDSFKSQQQKFPRVKTAYAEKEKLVKELFASKKVELSLASIFIRVFKEEGELEVWAKSADRQALQLIKQYSVCAKSGELGPKRKQGDWQVPEGFYTIDRFNPSSNYYLSLGVSYPNVSDRIVGEKGNLGGDIFIHGACVTIGCMPLTDDKIKEVYLIAVEARSNGQQHIPVHIFPFRMNPDKVKKFGEKYTGNTKLLSFWKNIQTGYDYFEKNRMLPSVSVLNNGEYRFN